MNERPVPRTPADPAGRALAHGRTTRLLLSALFVLHWVAVGALLVLDAAGQRLLAPPLRPFVQGALAPTAELVWPAARVWLDATATRQHWMLFAPAPSDWAVSVVGIAGFPGAATDTLVVPGPVEVPFPHWRRPRGYDFAFNLAYEGSGTFYRTVLARRLCRGVRAEAGAGGPDAITLGVLWQPLDAPWAETRRRPLYREVGSFPCAGVLAIPPARAPA